MTPTRPVRRTLEEWLAWQESLHPRGIELGLERVRRVAEALGVGNFTCPVVTVGGTNGKGSCVALLESMLAAGGYRVGTFTSPHLIRYNERIRIAGHLAEDAALVQAFERIEHLRGEVSLTFFEFNTLAALLLFQDTALDAVLLEVGLGGRLDAVNIIDSDVAVLASVGLDHCEWLGPTLEDIGREKAGIFRPGRPAVVGGPMPCSVAEVAERIGARLRMADPALMQGLPPPALAGPHQLCNATAALTVLDELRESLPLPGEARARGLREVHLSGRFEVVPGSPEWIFDVAHNPDAGAQLAANLAARSSSGRTLAVVGILADKDARAVIAPLLTFVDEWIAVGLSGPRGTTASALIERCQGDATRWHAAKGVAAGCELAARRAGPEDRIVVFGSFYTVGPALQWKDAAGGRAGSPAAA